MDINYVREKIQLIKVEGESDQDEEAHRDEDALYLEFVKYVASLDPRGSDKVEGLKNIATELLKTRDIEFSRWHA